MYTHIVCALLLKLPHNGADADQGWLSVARFVQPTALEIGGSGRRQDHGLVIAKDLKVDIEESGEANRIDGLSNKASEVCLDQLLSFVL
jgi:hypothetical protein